MASEKKYKVHQNGGDYLNKSQKEKSRIEADKTLHNRGYEGVVGDFKELIEKGEFSKAQIRTTISLLVADFGVSKKKARKDLGL